MFVRDDLVSQMCATRARETHSKKGDVARFSLYGISDPRGMNCVKTNIF